MPDKTKIIHVLDPKGRKEVPRLVPHDFPAKGVIICHLDDSEGDMVSEQSAINLCRTEFSKNGATPYPCSVCRYDPCMKGLSGRPLSTSGKPALAHSIESDGA